LRLAPLKFRSDHPKRHTMDMRQGFTIVIGLLIGLAVASVATWAACRWWYGRKLLAAAQRLHKSDQGRLFSQQQTAQAKKQIEALKKELDIQRKALTDTESSRQRTRDLEQALAAAERVVESHSGMMPLVAAHGFADTQIMP
jgi:hypothetical protein